MSFKYAVKEFNNGSSPEKQRFCLPCQLPLLLILDLHSLVICLVDAGEYLFVCIQTQKEILNHKYKNK